MARYRAGIETERRILDATRELLSEVGLEGATLAAICDRAGVRAGSFYNLFDSKEAAVLRVVGEAIQAVDPDPEGRHDTVTELVDAYITFVTHETEMARIYTRIAVRGAMTHDEVGQQVLRHHQRRVDRFQASIEREHPSLPAAEARRRAELLLATLNGLAFRWSLDNQFDFAGLARQALVAV